MSSYDLIGISVVWIIAILFIISWVFIYSEGKWLLKVILTLSVFALIFSSIFIWRELQGTPKNPKTVDGLIIRAYLIKEPEGKDKGNIWLWVIDPERKILEPLNIVIPYTKEIHKELVENQGLSRGRPQQISQQQGDSASPQVRLHDITQYDMIKK